MKASGIFYLILSSLIFAIFTIIAKDAMNNGVNTLSFIASSALVMIPIAIAYLMLKEKNIGQQVKKHWFLFLIIGLGAGFACRILWITGLSYTTAMNAGFIEKLAVVTTIIFAFFIIKERISKKAIIGGLIAIFGVFLLTAKGTLSAPNFGDTLIIMVVLIAGLTNVLAKILMSYSTPYFISSIRAIIGSSLIVLTTYFVLESQTFIAFETAFWHSLFGGACIMLFVFFLYKGFEIEGPSVGTAFFLLSAVFTVLFAYVFLNETLEFIQYIGAAIILAGLYLVARSK